MDEASSVLWHRSLSNTPRGRGPRRCGQFLPVWSKKKCLRLKKVTGSDMQDEVKCGLVTLLMKDDKLRQHWAE